MLTNLVGLCKFHHRCVHEGGYTIELAEDGSPLFHRPDGQVIDPAPKIRIDADNDGIERRNREHGIDIAPDTSPPTGAATPSTSSLATDNIMWDRKRAKELDLDKPEEPGGEVWTPPRE